MSGGGVMDLDGNRIQIIVVVLDEGPSTMHQVSPVSGTRTSICYGFGTKALAS